MRLIYRDDLFIFQCVYAEKDIPKSAGCRWNPSKKQWWTADLTVAEKLLQYADEDLKNKFEELIQEKEKRIEESSAVNVDIDIPVPKDCNYLPFQKAGIAYALKKKFILIADEMGLGKTIQAIGLINLLPEVETKRILVVCPASVKLNWRNELQKWLVTPRDITVMDSKCDYEISDGIYIINYDIVKKFEILHKEKWDIVIGDEVHYCKSRKAQRSKAFYKVVRKAVRKVYLTGTPILNRPIELQRISESLGFEPAKNFWYYAKRYCAAKQNNFGWDMTGASNLGELQEKLRSSIMVRRLKKDVLTELPAKSRQLIELPAKDYAKQIKTEQKLLDAMKEMKGVTKKSKDDPENLDYQNSVKKMKDFWVETLPEITRLRHQNAVQKISAVITHLENLLENENKIILFAHHKDVIVEIYKHFAGQVVQIIGDTPIEKRQEAVEEFQNNENIHLFIGSIKAAGIGITLTAASIVVFAELDWTPASMTQAEDRAHRIGQKNSVLVQHIVIENSIDAMLAKKLIAKQRILDLALNKHEPEKVEEIF